MIRGALLRPHPLNRRDPAGTEPEDLELPRRGRFGQKLLRKSRIESANGFQPLGSKAAANVAACCSAIATSKKRLGNSLAKATKPEPSFIAGVIAMTPGSLRAMSTSQSLKTSV